MGAKLEMRASFLFAVAALAVVVRADQLPEGDVSALSDSLIQEGVPNLSGYTITRANDDTRTKSKQYRVTIGTEYNKNVQPGESPGPSNCEIEMKIEGAYTKADGPFPNNVQDDAGNPMPIGFKRLKSYLGPTSMSYADASTMAAPLHPGLQAVMLSDKCTMNTAVDAATGFAQAIVAKSTSTEANECIPCDMNSKPCKDKIELGTDNTNGRAIGYGYQIVEPPELGGATPDATGVRGVIVQRGQIQSTDAGDLTSVTVQLKCPITDGTEACDPWVPKLMKIDTNDVMTGIGNGVYYLDVSGVTINEAPSSEVFEDSDGNDKLKRCMAATCEEEMERKLGLI